MYMYATYIKLQTEADYIFRSGHGDSYLILAFRDAYV